MANKFCSLISRNKNGDENVATLDAVAEKMKKWTPKELTLSDIRNSKESPAFRCRTISAGL
jgi:hypothetical protein